MKTRKINFTVQIPDDDFTESKAVALVQDSFGSYLIDLRKFPDDSHIDKDDKRYKELKSKKKKAGNILDEYVINSRK